MKWKFNNQDILSISDMSENTIGFIYKITNTDTGEYYIGKKNLYTKRKRKFGKKESKLVTDKRKKLYEIVVKESAWQQYRSSNTTVSKWKESLVDLTILRFCKTKKGLTYYEAEYQFKYDVLRDEKSKNDNIRGKFFRKDLEL